MAAPGTSPRPGLAAALPAHLAALPPPALPQPHPRLLSGPGCAHARGRGGVPGNARLGSQEAGKEPRDRPSALNAPFGALIVRVGAGDAQRESEVGVRVKPQRTALAAQFRNHLFFFQGRRDWIQFWMLCVSRARCVHPKRSRSLCECVLCETSPGSAPVGNCGDGCTGPDGGGE